MIDTIQLLGFLVAFAVALGTCFGFVFKMMSKNNETTLETNEKVTRIETNLTNLLQKEREDIARIEKKVDCLTDRVVDQESRLDVLERKVL